MTLALFVIGAIAVIRVCGMALRPPTSSLSERRKRTDSRPGVLPSPGPATPYCRRHGERVQ